MGATPGNSIFDFETLFSDFQEWLNGSGLRSKDTKFAAVELPKCLWMGHNVCIRVHGKKVYTQGQSRDKSNNAAFRRVFLQIFENVLNQHFDTLCDWKSYICGPHFTCFNFELWTESHENATFSKFLWLAFSLVQKSRYAGRTRTYKEQFAFFTFKTFGKHTFRMGSL